MVVSVGVGLVEVFVVLVGGTTGAGAFVVVVCLGLGAGWLGLLLGAGWLAGTVGAAVAGAGEPAFEPLFVARFFFFAGLAGGVVTVVAVVVVAAAAACVAVGVFVV